MGGGELIGEPLYQTGAVTVTLTHLLSIVYELEAVRVRTRVSVSD